MKTLFLSLLLSYPAFGDGPNVCNDEGKIYKVCSDQQEAYNAALERAKKGNKKLLVVVGAEWCPWCVSLHKMLGQPEALGKDFSKKYELVDIALYRDKTKVPSGEAVQELLKKQAGYTGKLAGIPVLAVVNPKSEKASIIDTEPLEQNTETSKGHNAKKVMAAIQKAERKLK